MEPRTVINAPKPREEDVLEAGEIIEIGNEFALVWIRRVKTRNGVRLEIASPKLGCKIYLDPLELESLTWQTHEIFVKLLEHPYGSGRR